MQMGEVLRALVSGSTIYVAMAACSASSGGGGAGQPGGASGSSGSAAAGGSSGIGGALDGSAEGQAGDDGSVAADGAGGSSGAGGSFADAFIDALTDPVADAKADPTVSGTRLRARYYSGADGSRQFLGWYDSVRKENCSFVVAATDGTTRCMPSTGNTVVSSTYTYFSDAACNNPVYPMLAGCSSLIRFQMLVYTTTACGASYTYRFYLAGAKVGATTIYQSVGTSCAATTASDRSKYDFYPLGAEIQPTEFVEATEQVE